jgi:hypothetical protein
MSEELIKSLNQRISELEKSKADLHAALKIERKEHKSLKEQHDDLLSKVDAEFEAVDAEKAELTSKLQEYESKFKAAPDEKDATITELQGKILERDHRDAWNKVIGSELHDKASVEKLWREVEYKPEGEPDPAKITEWVGKAKEAAPYLFRPTDPAGKAGGPASNGASQVRREPLKVTDSDGRGARDRTAGPSTYRRSDVQEPGWESKNKELAQAIRSGEATLVD